jgi:hypothetical protein
MAVRANGDFDSSFACLLFAVFTATAQVVRDHMREKEGFNWSCECRRGNGEQIVSLTLSFDPVVQTVGLEVYEQTLYLLWYRTG